MVHLARRLGPASFARVEYAAAVAAWLLVVVRGGVDVIVYREAARRPRLVRPLTEVLVGLRGVGRAGGLRARARDGRGWSGRDGARSWPSRDWCSFPRRSSPTSASGPRAGSAGVALAQVRGGRATRPLVLGLVRGPGRRPAPRRGAWWWRRSRRRRPARLARASTAGRGPRLRRAGLARPGAAGGDRGLTRFGRVSLYGGRPAGAGLVGRRPSSAPTPRRGGWCSRLVALGLVVPAAVAPSIAPALGGRARAGRGR